MFSFHEAKILPVHFLKANHIVRYRTASLFYNICNAVEKKCENRTVRLNNGFS